MQRRLGDVLLLGAQGALGWRASIQSVVVLPLAAMLLPQLSETCHALLEEAPLPSCHGACSVPPIRSTRTLLFSAEHRLETQTICPHPNILYLGRRRSNRVAISHLRGEVIDTETPLLHHDSEILLRRRHGGHPLGEAMALGQGLLGGTGRNPTLTLLHGPAFWEALPGCPGHI